MLTELTNITQSLVAFSLVLAMQIGLVLLLRKPVKAKLGAVACYRLWLLPMLWLPLYWLGPMLLEILNRLLYSGYSTYYYNPLQQFRQFELLPFNFSAETLEVATSDPAVNYGWPALALFWLTGTVAMIVWQGYRWLHLSNHINKFALPLPAHELEETRAVMHFEPKVPVLFLQGMRSAALFGVFKPVLLLPESFSQRYDNNQRHIILAHEAVHLRRRDNCWNLYALLLLALFWTNPLVLLAWHYYRLDQELSCDALALTYCNKEQQKRYARTLLDSLGSLPASGTQPALSAWDNLRDLKERSLMIKHHLLTATRPVTMLFSLMLLALLGATLTIAFAELANAAEPIEAQIAKVAGLIGEEKREEARTELQPFLQAGEQGQLSTEQYLQVLGISASLHMAAENYQEARADWEAILALPNLPEETVKQITYALAQSYIVEENWPKAVESLSQWLATPGREGPGPLYLLAVAHYQLQQYEEALPYIERTIELAVEKPKEAWYQLRQGIYLKTNRIAEARSSLQKMVELFDDDDDSKYQTMLDEFNASNPEAQ